MSIRWAIRLLIVYHHPNVPPPFPTLISLFWSSMSTPFFSIFWRSARSWIYFSLSWSCTFFNISSVRFLSNPNLVLGFMMPALSNCSLSSSFTSSKLSLTLTRAMFSTFVSRSSFLNYSFLSLISCILWTSSSIFSWASASSRSKSSTFCLVSS